MNSALRLALELAAAGAAMVGGAWAFVRLQRWRRRSPEELERQRRREVNRRGRITLGHVVDLVETENPRAHGRLILYKYEVAGVTYEAAQDISALPGLASAAHRLAGQTASVKYDPRSPTNSIIACEEWCGIKEIAALNH